MIPLNVNIYQRAATGATLGDFICNLAGRLDSYEHSITATCGFESMTCALKVTLEEALDWLANGLFRACVVSGPDAMVCWEGYLETIEAQFGQETRSASLRDMANRITVRYTTVLGTPGTTASTSDSTSQALYGVKDRVLSAGTTVSATATSLRDRALAQYKNPVMAPTTEVRSGDIGDVSLTLSFAGWYTTLEWVTTSRTSTTNTDTGTQVDDLIQTSGVGVGATNNFLNTSEIWIGTTGLTDTEYIAPDTTYRQKIDELLGKGDGTDRLAWGIYEDRMMHVDIWAGATPTTIDYYRYVGDGRIFNSGGDSVYPWDVRPDAMYQVIDLLDTEPVASAPDAVGRFYVERVVCSVSDDSIGVSLEPMATNAVDAMIARLGN